MPSRSATLLCLLCACEPPPIDLPPWDSGSPPLADAGQPDAVDAGQPPEVEDAGSVVDLPPPYDGGIPPPDAGGPYTPLTTLGRSGEHFRVNGTEKFLLGFSYFSCLYASDATLESDLDYLASKDVDLIRCWVSWPIHWATWQTQSPDNVVLVRADGTLDPVAVERLVRVVEAADRRGMLVDFTFNQDTPNKPFSAHQAGIAAAARRFVRYRNVLFDLQNETDHAPQPYFMDPTQVTEVRAAVALVDPQRLVTASVTGLISAAELVQYHVASGVQVSAYHCCRGAGWETATYQAVLDVRNTLACPAANTKPIYFQEPNRCACARGLTCSIGNHVDCAQSTAGQQFTTAARGARNAGAAAWVFHSPSSYDLRAKTAFAQLTDAERAALDVLRVRASQGAWDSSCRP